MPKIAPEDLISYGGAVEKIKRLGLRRLYDELLQILVRFDLRVEERKDANGGKTLRKMLDDRFQKAGGGYKKLQAILIGPSAIP